MLLSLLPDELLLRIFSYNIEDIDQLIQLGQVSKRFHRLLFIENPKLWYLAFKLKYPVWSHNVNYNSHSIDWKDFVVHLNKQHHSTRQFSFEFVQEQYSRKRKRLLLSEEAPFWIQDPLVTDIDRTTQTGVVATGKHRKKQGYSDRSEHKILFWEYPSWKLIRVFELNLQPQSLTCQIIGIQSVPMISSNNIPYTARFFSLAVGTSLINGIDTEDRVDIWKSLFIYRLFDNGDTQCMLHLKITESFLGREVFLFSDTSWTQSNAQDWMKITLPEQQDFDTHHTIFVLAMGPVYHHVTGFATLSKFDIRGDVDILDPSLVECMFSHRTRQLIALSETLSYLRSHILMDGSFFDSKYAPPSEILTHIRLGDDVSCMIHFKYPSQLNHLICTGSSQENELSVYDWRFGVKVGTLPWMNNVSDMEGVRPWGLETTFVLQPDHGFRLIAVGDNRGENMHAKLEIKAWDISYLLSTHYNPLEEDASDDDFVVLSDYVDHCLHSQFRWWPRRTKQLTQLALCTIQRKFGIHQYQHFVSTTTFHHQHYQHNDEQQRAPLFELPYSPPLGHKSVLLSHTFEKDVKYTAYNVLNTSLFLLTEDGKVTVMDIETGQITGTDSANHPRVKGIDVNVVGGNEVVVTSKEGLLRRVVS